MVLGAGLAYADATIPTKDEDGSRDHPLLKRYEGSLIVNDETKAYDELTVPLSTLKLTEDEEDRDAYNNRVVKADNTLQLEGAYTRLIYIVPEGRSPLEVMRNYQQEIKSSGEILAECKNEDCGGQVSGNATGGGVESLMMVLYPRERVTAPAFSNGECASNIDVTEQRYTVGKLSKDGGEAVIAVLAYAVEDDLYCKAFNGRTLVMVLVLENKAREQKMVTVSAAEMQSAIASTGRIALYGIFFDFDKADIKSESKPALDEIAKLLADNPDLKVLIVGHTDNVGKFDYNIKLSERRAKAVVEALKRDYGIDGGRLRPAGVGMMAPTATNDTDDGRAKNRRVELVKL
jgi:outer membrane protein OmpA-like peptidoglycan-associated protein